MRRKKKRKKKKKKKGNEKRRIKGRKKIGSTRLGTRDVEEQGRAWLVSGTVSVNQAVELFDFISSTLPLLLPLPTVRHKAEACQGTDMCTPPHLNSTSQHLLLAHT